MSEKPILVVEDEAIIARDIAYTLEQLGYRVAGPVATAEDALSTAKEASPRLVLMDIQLKGKGDGIHAAQQITEQLDIPVIFLTSHSDDATLDRAKKAGPYGYLIKPFLERELYSAIEVATAKHASEAQTRQLARWSSSMMDAVADAVLVTDADFRIRHINTAAAVLTGWPSAQAAGRPINDVLPLLKDLSNPETVTPVDLRSIESPEPFLVSLVNRTGADLDLEVRVTRLSEGPSRGDVAVIVRDARDSHSLRSAGLKDESGLSLVVILNREGNVTYASPSARQWLDVSELQSRFVAVWSGGQRGTDDGRGGKTLESHLRDKDGKTRRVEWWLSGGADGSIVCLGTEQTVSSTAAASGQAGTWTWDLKRGAITGSREWRTLMGLGPSSSDLTVDEWTGLIHADDLNALEDEIRKLREGEATEIALRHRVKKTDGDHRFVLTRASVAHVASGKPVKLEGTVSFADRAPRKASEQPVDEDRFMMLVSQRLEDLASGGGENFAVVAIRIDGLEQISDNLGAKAAHEVMDEAARRLNQHVRGSDALSRLDSAASRFTNDQFALALTHGDELGDVLKAADRLQETLSGPVSLEGQEVHLSTTFGIASAKSGDTAEELLKNASIAAHFAKRRGFSQSELYDADKHRIESRRWLMGMEMRPALNRGEFSVAYQPIIALASGELVGFEALARWTRNGEAVPPLEFIPVAEETGLIVQLGEWIFETAIRQLGKWTAEGTAPKCWVSINLSPKQVEKKGVHVAVRSLMETMGLDSSRVSFEITETALVNSTDDSIANLEFLRKEGIRIAIDDFGTGYSSLTYLHQLPVDALKIDRSFVQRLGAEDGSALVSTIISLGRKLGLKTVAEGIETRDQLDELRALGCDFAQGFYIARPMTLEQVSARWKDNWIP